MSTKAHDDSDYRAQENEVVKQIAEIWKARPFRLPRFYWLSHTLVEGKKPICFIDVRIRRFSWKQHKTVLLPLSKILRGIEIQNMTGIPFVMAVKFTDKLCVCRPADMPIESLTNVHILGDVQKIDGTMQEIDPQVMIDVTSLEGLA